MGTVATNLEMWEEFQEFYKAKVKLFPESKLAENYSIIDTPDSLPHDKNRWREKWMLIFVYDSISSLIEGFIREEKYHSTTEILRRDLQLEGTEPGFMALYFTSLEERTTFCELFSDDLETWNKKALRKCLKMYGITMKEFKEKYYEISSRF